MTNQELKDRLKASGMTRAWLAKEIGVSSNTMAMLLSTRRITDRTEVAINKAFETLNARPTSSPSDSSTAVTASFTLGEFAKINRAMHIGNYSDVQAFFRDAVIEYTDSLCASDSLGNSKIVAHPSATMGRESKVAEDPGAYGTHG